ncbi:MAG: GH3 auxin-responsive promoter family protein [Saprospiraceae bacterium]
MGLKSYIVKRVASFAYANTLKMQKNAVKDQSSIMHHLVRNASQTKFGLDHHFRDIHNYESFKSAIPIKDYEGIKHYIELIKSGETNVLWKGKPKYFAKTSGTTSGIKYIPITEDSLPNHLNSARTAMFNYFHLKGSAAVFDGNVIFLSGSPELEHIQGIPTGRLSGIVNHEIPSWIRKNQLPSLSTNCIEDWEEKLEMIIEETVKRDMRLISGIPPWVQMYYEKILAKTGKSTVKQVFPNLSLFIYGGVNFEPYRYKLESLIGSRIDSIETYPASEGFIAFQDDYRQDGLLLNTNSGIFFEFIPLEKVHDRNPDRIMLKDVEVGKDYAIIIHNNAGLFGYDIGDCVRFISINPYRLVVSGRVKHYISAFGEHVIGKEVDEAMTIAAKEFHIKLVEFTVAPQVNPVDGNLPYHEWFVEFDGSIENLSSFESRLDEIMRVQNIYYDDLIAGKILKPLKVSVLKKDAFRDYMKSIGKLGGQNKVPRLSNDRKIADHLQKYLEW